MGEYYTKTCAVCGKEMVIRGRDGYGYKIKPAKGATLFFCTYGHMREYEKDHEEPKTAVVREEPTAEKKEPQSRAEVAKILAEVVRNGGSVIAKLTEMGYKNPYQAYDAIRHYCETKNQRLAAVLKPPRDLPKAPHKKTGRPRKHPEAEVTTVDKVPDLEQPEEQVAEMLNLQGGVNYQLKVDEAMKAEKPEEEMADPHPQEVLLTLDHVLRTVDEAALECNGDEKFGIWSNEDLGKVLFREAWKNAKKTGVMEMRKAIRQKLGVTE